METKCIKKTGMFRTVHVYDVWNFYTSLRHRLRLNRYRTVYIHPTRRLTQVCLGPYVTVRLTPNDLIRYLKSYKALFTCRQSHVSCSLCFMLWFAAWFHHTLTF